MAKAYSYLRFSTPEQSKGDSQRRQLDLAQRYADEQALELDTELTFHDLGVSAFRGVNADTGRLGDFLRAVDAGMVERGSFLLVESLDRISRSTARKALRVLEDIIEKGVIVVTLSDKRVYDGHSLDNDPMALLMSILVFMRAHEESAIKSARLRAAYGNKRRAAKESKTLFTRRLPAWMRFDEDTKTIELIPEHAAVVREIFDWAAAGFDKSTIARRLNERNEPTWGKATFWQPSYVQKILSNPACKGDFVPNTKDVIEGRLVRKPQETIEAYFPPVVDVLPVRNGTQARGRHASSPVRSIFAGLGRCSKCGSTVTRVSKGKYVYLVCTKAHAKAGCDYYALPYAMAEATFLGNIERVIADAPRGHDTDMLERNIEGLEWEMTSLEDDLRDMADAYRRTKSPTIRAKVTEMEAQWENMKGERDKARQEVSERASGVVIMRLEKLREAAAGRDVAEINLALREVVKVVEFDLRLWRIGVMFNSGREMRETMPVDGCKRSPFDAVEGYVVEK